MNVSRCAAAVILGLRVGIVSIGLQIVTWLIVCGMDLLGFVHLQRRILEYAEIIYEPSWKAFRIIVPSAWQFTGNILLGFVQVAFGVGIYGVLAGAAAGFTQLLVSSGRIGRNK